VPSGKTALSEKKSAKKGAAAVRAAKTTKAVNTVKPVNTAKPVKTVKPAPLTKKAGPARKKPAPVAKKTAASAKGTSATTTKPAKKQTTARVSGRGPAPQPPARAPQKRSAEADEKPRAAFLAEQRTLLLKERDSYTRQAEELKAEADSLALEHEPGDVQFDEEGGEGGTSNVDRELDLVLSAQARGAIAEIDRALAKINAGTYGRCEQCGNPIPQARLKALPYAALCVACKSGGLSRR
jgi:DnaK suppressor protein